LRRSGVGLLFLGDEFSLAVSLFFFFGCCFGVARGWGQRGVVFFSFLAGGCLLVSHVTS
jgi:hypothetical protein